MHTLSCTIDDWRCDQYRWINRGVHKLPSNSPLVKKFYFIIDTPQGPSTLFKRHAYQLIGKAEVTLVHYIGDESIGTNFPHRGSVEADKTFIRTLPSYLNKCKDLIKTQKPSKVYKKEVSEMGASSVTEKPRNVKQLANLRYQHLQEQRISHDTMFNIHEIAYDIPQFIWKIMTYPNLICIFGMKDLLQEADQVLTLQDPPSPQLLSYDTTFKLGNFYLSSLLIRHTAFKQRPCVPVLFMIHERKLTDTHVDMFQEIFKLIPSFSKAHVPIVTDREKAITNAIKRVMPNVRLVYCWNHILRDVRFWCRKHDAPSADISKYLEDMLELFRSSSPQLYESRLEEKMRQWDVTFQQFYMSEIHEDVDQSIGRQVLEGLNIYNPYSGVTSNQSESMNR